MARIYIDTNRFLDFYRAALDKIDFFDEFQKYKAQVAEIADSIAAILLAVQFAESGYAAQTQEEFDKAYKTWETQ